MSDLWIEGEVADQLRDLAQREQRSVESVLKTLLARYMETEASPTLAQLALALAEVGFHSGQKDTATRSREIIETEYADYLMRRKRGQEDA
ncbi:MAG: hypothetical protein GC204_02505 [Chloroflexi bacterium]|nr:hypothetical protein [Chloroflexota bacterium]